ncbi:hypothetical protein TNCV_853851 [Trichonephila clavipes]|nr:hypothetical protein TNCV_853851 [Trichonephila clavipes]
MTSLAGLALDSETSSGLGRAPALQCRAPSRHHLELQDRRDYTPADRTARTCWLGRPGLLGRIVAYRDSELSSSEISQRVRRNQATMMRIRIAGTLNRQAYISGVGSRGPAIYSTLAISNIPTR